MYIHLYNIYYTEHLRTLEHFFFLPQDQEIDTLLRVSSFIFFSSQMYYYLKTQTGNSRSDVDEGRNTKTKCTHSDLKLAFFF